MTTTLLFVLAEVDGVEVKIDENKARLFSPVRELAFLPFLSLHHSLLLKGRPIAGMDMFDE